MAALVGKLLIIQNQGDTYSNTERLVKHCCPELSLLKAKDLISAKRVAGNEDPDVILLSDWEVCLQLKEDIKTRDIPVLFCTYWHTSQDIREMALNYGADAFLPEAMPEIEMIALLKAMIKLRTLSKQISPAPDGTLFHHQDNPVSLEDYIRARQDSNIAAKSFDAINDAICLIDRNQLIVRVNAATDRMFPYVQEIIGKPYYEVIYGSLAPVDNCPVMLACQNSVCQEAEMEFNGRWFKLNADPILDQTGAVEYCILIVSDISARKQAEIDLKKSEEQFRNMVESLPVAICMFRGEEQKILYLNPKFKELFGYSQEEISTIDKWWPLAYPNENYRKMVSDTWLSRVGKTTEMFEEIEPMEVLVNCKDGSEKHILFGYRNLGEYGFAVGLDLSGHRQAEQALKISEDRYALALEATHDGIWDWDLVTKSEYTSPRWQQIMGYEPGDPELLHPTASWEARIHPEDKKMVLQRRNALTRENNQYYAEYRILHKTGGYRWLRSTGKGIFAPDGRPLRVVGSILDITERKFSESELIASKETAEENNRLKTAFLNNMSHEVRTPLNAILGFAELLSGADQEEQKYFINVIQKSSNQLLALFEDTMYLARLQSEKLPVYISEIDPAGLLLEIYQMFSIPELNHGVEIIVKTDMQPDDLRILSDEAKIKQVLTHLTSNALKYTLEGTVELGLINKCNCLEFYVLDNGPGISEKEQGLIFENFYRGENSIAEAIGGTGVGLKIAKELVTLLGGTIGVDSELSKGSRFFFTLPFEKLPETATRPETPALAKKNLKDLEILMVEDEFLNCRILEYMLKGKVRKIDFAVNGQDAVKMVSRNTYDLVLMDLRMPVMGGIAATLTLKNFFPDLLIIAQSDHNMPEDRLKAINAGCADFISKPLKKEVVMEMIYKYAANDLD